MRKTIKVLRLEQRVDYTLRGEFPTAIKSPADAAAVMKQYIGSDDRETFAILLLDTKHKINWIHPVSTGSLNASIVTPRETFKAAIEANASAIILSHNHPSGDTTPSKEDLAITQRLLEAGKIIGIEVLDHVIVAPNNYYSLKEHGHI